MTSSRIGWRARVAALAVLLSGCAPLRLDFRAQAQPPAEGEPVACTSRKPCPVAADGVWMSTELAAYFASTQSCCNDCQEKLRGCDSNAPEWWVIGLAAGLGIAAGGFAGYQLSR